MAWKTKLAEIYTEFTAKLSPLRTAMAKANAMIKRGMKTMARWAKRGAIAIGVGLAAALVWATKAAMKEEQANIDLAAALRTTGDATEENIAKFKRYASELQRLTIYGDEEIKTQMAYAKNLGVTTDQIEAATKAAIGLAAKYKLDLRAAMMLVGRASQGQTESLTRYGIVLKEGLSDQEKFNAILGLGSDAFVLAEEAATSARSKLTQFWNVVGDVAETVGGKILDRIIPIVDAMKQWVQTHKELIDQKIDTYYNKVSVALKGLWEKSAWLYEKRKPIGWSLIGAGALWALSKAAQVVLVIWGFTKGASLAVAKFGKGIRSLVASWLAVRASIAAVQKSLAAFYGAKQLKMIMKSAGMLGGRLAAIGGLLKTLAATIFTVTNAAIAGIGIIIIQVGLLVNALWSAHKSKKKIREYEKAASKEEIEEYKAAIRATDKYKAKLEEKRKVIEAAENARKKAAAAEVRARQRIDERLAAEKKAITDEEKARLARIETLKKQLAMYKEMVGYESKIAAIEKELASQRAKTISKELGISTFDVSMGLDAKAMDEALAAEAKLTKEKEEKRKRLFQSELSMLEALYTDAVGKESQLAQVKKKRREEEAKAIAAASNVTYKDALKILDAKVKTEESAIAAARIGMASFEQAWSQIATGASQTEKEIAKATKETAKYAKQTVEELKTIKTEAGGFGP